jgi:hypothetical protein
MSDPKQKPVHSYQSGALRVAIWRQEAKDGKIFFTATAQRTRDDGKSWEYSDTFNRDDLPVVANLLDAAHLWIVATQRKTAIIRLDGKWIAVESNARAEGSRGHHWLFRITADDPRFDSLSEAVRRADGFLFDPSDVAGGKSEG